MPWHYYISQGLPLLTFFQLPWVLKGMFLVDPPTTAVGFSMRTMRSGTLKILFFFSLLAHKEVRFVQPLLPFLHFFAAVGFLSPLPSRTSVEVESNPSSLTVRRQRKSNFRGPTIATGPTWFERNTFYRALLATGCLMPAFYLNRYHSVAQISVLEYLRTLPRSELSSLAFLMPCHSTPWQSHLHRPDLEDPSFGGSGEAGRLWFLTCEPPIL